MLLTPEYIFKNVEAITPAFLQQLGVTALVLDVDNTLTGDGSQQLDDSVSAWLDTMRAAGVSLTIVSNNTDRRGPALCHPHRAGLGAHGLQAAAHRV